MPNHLQEAFTTTPSLNLNKKEQQIDDEIMVSLQAEKIVNSLALPMVFKAALELGVIDTIAALDDSMWLSPSEIALSLPIKPTNPEGPVLLDRMLRFLTSHSILKCRMVETVDSTGTVYAAEPVCKFFLKDTDGSGSLFSMFMLYQSQVQFKTWTHLKDVILEGKDAFSSAHGMPCFEYIRSNEQFGEVFNGTMSETSTMIMNKVLEVYKGFEDVNTLVDVGGGLGTIIGLVTSKYPHIRGINFDLPAVLAHAPLYPGVEHMAGDMFVEVPKGDAIFFKWILHDWSDDDCAKILKNCWKSLPTKGKVIIVDMVMPIEPKSGGDLKSNILFGMDAFMLTQTSGGKERTLSQFKNLAYRSGFTRCEIAGVAYSYSVIELHK